MRNFLSIVFLTIILFAACDNRADSLNKIDYLSSFQLTKESNNTLIQNDTAYSDTLKPENETVYSYSLDGATECEIDLDYYTSLFDIELNKSNQTITCSTKQTGKATINITITDPFLQTKTFPLTINTIENRLPVAVATITDLGVEGEYHMEIDASSSYDADEIYGGGIITYEYEIVGEDKVEITASKYRQALSSGDTCTIQIRVQDNDGEWSPITSYEFSF
jgi:hypothetical protein